MPSRSTLLAFASLLLALTGCGGGEGAGAGPVAGSRRVLVDSIHAHNFIDAGLAENVFDYHKTNGYHLAFSFLKSQGVDYDIAATGQLDAASLSQHAMLFVNLVSADLPPFTVPEIKAIVAYIQAGGAAMFITDHSNCYFHAWKLKPLFGELGMDVFTETVCEAGPGRIGDGAGWIDVSRFEKHPVTEGLRHIAFQTGGAVDDRFGVARTSDKAWGDQWAVHPYGDGDNLGLYGNWRKDPGEREGSFAVVAAKTLGKGRIVVMADQNAFGDPFIRYADNHRLFFNSVNWLLKDDPARARELAAGFAAWRSPRILCYEDFKQGSFGSANQAGFYHLFVHLQRRYWTLADDELAGEYAAIVFAEDRKVPDDDLDLIVNHLRAGRGLLVLRPSGFAFTGEDTLTGQLASRLGQPAGTQASGIVEIAQFKDAGRVYLVLQPELFGSAEFTHPDRPPTQAQEAIQRRLDALIDKIIKAK